MLSSLKVSLKIISNIYGLLIYTLEIPGIYYPLKFALLNGYLFIRDFADSLNALISCLETGTILDEETFNKICLFLGIAEYLKEYEDLITSARIRFGTKIDKLERFDRGFRVFEKILDDYSKIRKKDEVKLKDMKDILYRVATFIG